MHSLKPYNDPTKGLADLLDWAALVDDGVVQGKSGALLAGWFYQGQDIASSTADERNYITPFGCPAQAIRPRPPRTSPIRSPR
jgi:type IV secretory pathway VirB4 component